MKKQTKDKFINIIKEQKNLYSSLKELISTEYKALADKDIQTIDGIIKKQEEIISSIKKMEDEKSAVFGLMAEETGLKNDSSVKLRDILVKLDKKDAQEIEKAVIELLSVVKETESVNAQNTGLIRNYIEYVDFVRNVKGKIEKPVQTTYTQNGQKKSETIKKDPKIDTTI